MVTSLQLYYNAGPWLWFLLVMDMYWESPGDLPVFALCTNYIKPYVVHKSFLTQSSVYRYQWKLLIVNTRGNARNGDAVLNQSYGLVYTSTQLRETNSFISAYSVNAGTNIKITAEEIRRLPAPKSWIPHECARYRGQTERRPTHYILTWKYSYYALFSLSCCFEMIRIILGNITMKTKKRSHTSPPRLSSVWLHALMTTRFLVIAGTLTH